MHAEGAACGLPRRCSAASSRRENPERREEARERQDVGRPVAKPRLRIGLGAGIPDGPGTDAAYRLVLGGPGRPRIVVGSARLFALVGTTPKRLRPAKLRASYEEDDQKEGDEILHGSLCYPRKFNLLSLSDAPSKGNTCGMLRTDS